MLDLSDRLWQLGVPPFELVVRSVAVYAIFLFALRVSGKRELGQFTIFDIAAVLLAANALQPAITGPDASIPGAIVIVATLFVLNHGVAWARRRFKVVRRILEPTPTTIAADGAWIPAALDREDLDDDDLGVALRQHGLDDVADVKLAVLEHDGTISVVPRKGPPVRLRTARRYRAHSRQP